MSVKERGGIGQSARRVDGEPKVTGEYAYGSDLRTENMLWGATVRAPHASARILAIHSEPIRHMDGVACVLTAADLEHAKTFGLEFCDQPVLAEDVVRFRGEAVAVVAAETYEQARLAAASLVVDYEPLPAVTDMEQALQPDAPRVHHFGNVLRHVHIDHGDPASAFADVWVEGYYETAMQDQAALGPEGGLAVPAADGGIDLYAVTQWIHIDRQQIAPCLGLPEEKVRITLAGVGGAFGSREDITMQIHACLLALRTHRAVKMVYGREESFHGHVHRHPSRTWLRLGATRDGKLVAGEARLLMDGGAYASSSPAVISNASTFAVGPYEMENVRVEGTVVYTNNPPCGAMRGFGAPQVCFAYEAAMDELAAKLGIDPIELRLLNAVKTGSVLPTGQVLDGSAPLREVIERCRAIPLRRGRPRRGPRRDRVSRRRRQRQPRRVAQARRRLRGRLQEHHVQRGLRRRLRGDRLATPVAGGSGREHPDGCGRLRPGAVHDPRPDRPHGARRRAGAARAVDERRRLGRLDVRLAADDDDRRRRAQALPGDPRRTRQRGAHASRSRAPARTTTGRRPRSTSTDRGVRT